MKFKLFLYSIFKGKNIGILLLSLGAIFFLNNAILPNGNFPSMFFPTNNPFGDGRIQLSFIWAFIPYLFFSLQTMFNKKSFDILKSKEKIQEIINLNKESQRLFREAKKHTNSKYYKKLSNIMTDKNQIVDSFFKEKPDFLKQKIVEKTLNLVINYTRLLINFCVRSREMSQKDITDIAKRINENARKMNFTNDLNLKENLKNLVEIDEKMIESIKLERKDLDSISMKLDYIESTVDMFKHQILSSVDSEELLEKLEVVVNEASALDNVLYDRRKSKFRI